MSFFLLFLPVEPTLVGKGEKQYLLEEIPNPTALFPDSSSLALGERGLRCQRTIRILTKVKLSLLPIFFF